MSTSLSNERFYSNSICVEVDELTDCIEIYFYQPAYTGHSITSYNNNTYTINNNVLNVMNANGLIYNPQNIQYHGIIENVNPE